MATADLNMVALVGRLTRDADMRYMNNGNAVVNMSLAVNRSKKEGDQWVSEAHFFDISYFGRGAEAVKPYLTKGKQIAVQGSLKQDRWEKEGQKFSRVTVMADSVELLGTRSDSGGSYQQQGAPLTHGGGYSPADGGETFGGDNTEFPEDIPF